MLSVVQKGAVTKRTWLAKVSPHLWCMKSNLSIIPQNNSSRYVDVSFTKLAITIIVDILQYSLASGVADLWVRSHVGACCCLLVTRQSRFESSFLLISLYVVFMVGMISGQVA